MSRIKIFFVCSGLGVINRGYESFTRECFDALKVDHRLDVYLYKGGGVSLKKEKTLFNLPRFKSPAKLLGKLFGKEGYTIEQFSFCLSLIPSLLFRKPQVVLVSDFILSTYLFHVRRFFNLKYKIIFSNGAPNGPPFDRCDHVQQLLPLHFNTALQGGTPSIMQSIIPYGIKIGKNKLINKEEISEIRATLSIPRDAFIVITVAAINKYHKRADYLINEFAQLKKQNSLLIILGQMDNEAEEILQLAKDKLPLGNYIIKSVPHPLVEKYYLASDLFVLASLTEGLPRVMIEALSYGLPIIAHDYNIPHEVLEGNGYLADFTKPNQLSKLLEKVASIEYNSAELINQRVNFATAKYSWTSIKENYIEMIEKTAAGL